MCLHHQTLQRMDWWRLWRNWMSLETWFVCLGTYLNLDLTVPASKVSNVDESADQVEKVFGALSQSGASYPNAKKNPKMRPVLPVRQTARKIPMNQKTILEIRLEKRFSHKRDPIKVIGYAANAKWREVPRARIPRPISLMVKTISHQTP